MSEEEAQIRKGLAGVVADHTAISKVSPETNSLLYRGYPVQDLATQCSFEEVAYLLWHGELPDAQQLATQNRAEGAARALPEPVVTAISALPRTCHPMDVVRTAISVLGAHDASTEDPEQFGHHALRLFAQLPAVVAFDQRRRRGQDIMPPDEDLTWAENFLAMTFGQVPDQAVVRAFEVSMVLYAEHSFNASTFTARVITSTLSDLYSAVTGAAGALKGSLHGGANEAVMAAFSEIGTAENVRPWLEQALAEKRKIMGFGHRVYKNGDSRVPTMRAVLDDLVAHAERPDLGELYEALASEMEQRKNILPNLDYPAGPAYHLMGFDTQTFTPLFVASRITGWTAHIMEQHANNALIRPLSAYNGPDQREVPAR